ncbi:hypothetical protein [Variovorax sp. PAMC 28711]|uniref:hypothetical protein n=1 Tax=Variovorax sp. PAMC 28711 TaxID=1795631 RepID=UPI00078EECC8|nr:hypothetical protein [Variovorax sp. PAMC 28711]AMM23419.1 hypothetical protein AX767_02855 [Variovorax sp. PAMC 28711]
MKGAKITAMTCHRILLALTLALVAPLASAQAPASEFPLAATGFLNEELPRMETAVAERDRDYFEESMGRAMVFSEQWGFKTKANPALARYKPCSDAVSDYIVVGLCRLIPSGDVCEPGLAPRFNSNLKLCRDMAAAR